MLAMLVMSSHTLFDPIHKPLHRASFSPDNQRHHEHHCYQNCCRYTNCYKPNSPSHTMILLIFSCLFMSSFDNTLLIIQLSLFTCPIKMTAVNPVRHPVKQLVNPCEILQSINQIISHITVTVSDTSISSGSISISKDLQLSSIKADLQSISPRIGEYSNSISPQE